MAKLCQLDTGGDGERKREREKEREARAGRGVERGVGARERQAGLRAVAAVAAPPPPPPPGAYFNAAADAGARLRQ